MSGKIADADRCCEYFPTSTARVGCDLRKGHDGWHEGIVIKEETIKFTTATYQISTLEKVSWEPPSVALGRALSSVGVVTREDG